MQKRYAVQVKWALEQTEAALAPLAAKAMGIAPGQIEAVEITKQSIDARKGGVCFQVALAVSVRRLEADRGEKGAGLCAGHKTDAE